MFDTGVQRESPLEQRSLAVANECGANNHVAGQGRCGLEHRIPHAHAEQYAPYQAAQTAKLLAHSDEIGATIFDGGLRLLNYHRTMNCTTQIPRRLKRRYLVSLS